MKVQAKCLSGTYLYRLLVYTFWLWKKNNKAFFTMMSGDKIKTNAENYTCEFYDFFLWFGEIDHVCLILKKIQKPM